jgi:hypothetical protein
MSEKGGGSVLDRLAERMGIVSEFLNARGATVRTDDAIKRITLKTVNGSRATAAVSDIDTCRYLEVAPINLV